MDPVSGTDEALNLTLSKIPSSLLEPAVALSSIVNDSPINEPKPGETKDVLTSKNVPCEIRLPAKFVCATGTPFARRAMV